MPNAAPPISAEILAEAADWLVEMQSAALSPAQQLQFQTWHDQSPVHQHAWLQAQQLQHCLQALSPPLKKQLLEEHPAQLPKFFILAVLMGSLTVGLYSLQQQAYFADYRNSSAQPQQILLADGTHITLNAKTAIDVDYNPQQRSIKLHYGEIFIHTAKDHPPSNRPFLVLGQHGSIQALGTQFDVKQLKHATEVAVLEHAVRINTQKPQSLQLVAGQATTFDADQIQAPHALDASAYAWKDGLIVADRMPMAQFAQQIEKYYPIRVDLSPEIKSLIISGTYANNDLEALLSALAQAYHLQRSSSYWGDRILISKQK
jgi:transmembrane sensor